MDMFSDFMVNMLAHDATQNGYRYLLVDTSATRPVDISARLRMNGLSVDLFTSETCNWRDCASPVLLELPSKSSDESVCLAAGNFLATWGFANCFTYIESPYEWSTVLTALGARTEAVLPENVSVLLRYFDNRILPVLLQTLSQDQRQAFLSLGTRWAIPGRHGELQQFENSDASQQPALGWPIQLDTAQETALIDAGEADALNDVLLSQDNPVLHAMSPPEQYERISELLDNAKTMQINQLSEQVAFCTLALELGTGFHEDPSWASHMQEVRAGRLRFSEALGRIAAEEME